MIDSIILIISIISIISIIFDGEGHETGDEDSLQADMRHDMIHETGHRTQDTGYRIQDTGYRIQDTGHRIQDTEYGIYGERDDGEDVYGGIAGLGSPEWSSIYSVQKI